MDPALLKKIAEKTDGEFYRSKDKKGLETNLHEILDSFERASVQDISSVNRRQIYGGFLGWAVFLLLLEVVLTYAFIRPFP